MGNKTLSVVFYGSVAETSGNHWLLSSFNFLKTYILKSIFILEPTIYLINKLKDL